MPECNLSTSCVFYPKSIEKTCVQKGKDVKTLCSCADLCGDCVHILRAVGTNGDIGDFPLFILDLFVMMGGGADYAQCIAMSLTDLKTFHRA